MHSEKINIEKLVQAISMQVTNELIKKNPKADVPTLITRLRDAIKKVTQQAQKENFSTVQFANELRITLGLIKKPVMTPTARNAGTFAKKQTQHSTKQEEPKLPSTATISANLALS